MNSFHRQEKLAWCRELLDMAVPPQPDTAPTDTDPIPPPNREAMVTDPGLPPMWPGRIVVVVEFPPVPSTEGITAGLDPCLILDSS